MNEPLVKAIQNETWAILPSQLEAMIAVAKSGMKIEAARRSSQQAGTVAVIPVYGMITQRGGGMFEMMFGGTSAEGLAAAIRGAVAEESIKAIVLDVDSPGGTVGGVQEAFDAIHSLRGQKPITAVANSLMASAAYWLASAADTIVAAPSSQVGSIGVFSVHEDISAAAEKAGVKVTMISAGKFKTEGNEFEPLSEEARAAIQKRVDGYYGQFVSSVAKGRGVTAGAVRGGFGEGRVVGANEAVALGMVDRVGTLGQTLAGFGVGGEMMRALGPDSEVVALSWADNEEPEFARNKVEVDGDVHKNEVEREKARWDAA